MISQSLLLLIVRQDIGNNSVAKRYGNNKYIVRVCEENFETTFMKLLILVQVFWNLGNSQ